MTDADAPPLPRISVSVKAAVLSADRVLLLSHADGYFHYNLPGGKARAGEPLRSAVIRKVAEETGIQVAVDRLLYVVEYEPSSWKGEYGTVHKVQFNFLARCPDPAPAVRPVTPDPLQIGHRWVPVALLGRIPLLPRVGEPLRAALDRTLGDPMVDRW